MSLQAKHLRDIASWALGLGCLGLGSLGLGFPGPWVPELWLPGPGVAGAPLAMGSPGRGCLGRGSPGRDCPGRGSSGRGCPDLLSRFGLRVQICSPICHWGGRERESVRARGTESFGVVIIRNWRSHPESAVSSRNSLSAYGILHQQLESLSGSGILRQHPESASAARTSSANEILGIICNYECVCE